MFNYCLVIANSENFSLQASFILLFRKQNFFFCTIYWKILSFVQLCLPLCSYGNAVRILKILLRLKSSMRLAHKIYLRKYLYTLTLLQSVDWEPVLCTIIFILKSNKLFKQCSFNCRKIKYIYTPRIIIYFTTRGNFSFVTKRKFSIFDNRNISLK